jgi:hypothetical protein
MQFAFVRFFSILYCIAVLAERVQYCVARRRLPLDRSGPVSVEQAAGKPSKVRSKAALRLAGAKARNTAIVVSAIAEQENLRTAVAAAMHLPS